MTNFAMVSILQREAAVSASWAIVKLKVEDGVSREAKCLVTNSRKLGALPRRADATSSTQFSFMHSLLFLLSLFPTLIFAAGLPQTRGVHPSLLSHYTTKGTTWTCLDGTKSIPWSAVNDDYCDCLDGSDEPGAFFSA